MNYQKIILNEEGRNLLKLKEELTKISPESAKNFINVSHYKKELLDNKITVEFFEEILKSDKRFLLSEKEIVDYYAKNTLKEVESLTDKLFTTTEKYDNYNIEVYIGMTNKNYSDYMNIDINGLLLSEDEYAFATKVSNRRVNAVMNQIKANIEESIKIPKRHSKNIIIGTKRKLEKEKRYLYDGVIYLTFPKEYILEYKNLNKIILEFLNLTWEGIDKYKTW